jgi:hypothetical protein
LKIPAGERVRSSGLADSGFQTKATAVADAATTGDHVAINLATRSWSVGLQLRLLNL